MVKLLNSIVTHSPEIIMQLVTKAKEDGSQAAHILLARVLLLMHKREIFEERFMMIFRDEFQKNPD